MPFTTEVFNFSLKLSLSIFENSNYPDKIVLLYPVVRINSINLEIYGDYGLRRYLLIQQVYRNS